ncbi:MAG: hypothetical protein Q4B17_03755 [Lautropia sp.]|nr:hypothetical protein [Lautropia sp.]
MHATDKWFIAAERAAILSSETAQKGSGTTRGKLAFLVRESLAATTLEPISGAMNRHETPVCKRSNALCTVWRTGKNKTA